MKRKILSAVLTLFMVLAMIPMTAFAAEDEICAVYDADGYEIGRFSDLNEATAVAVSKYEEATIQLLDDVEVKCGENTYFHSLGYSDSYIDNMFGIDGAHSVLGLFTMGSVTYDLNHFTLTILPSDSYSELNLPDYMSAYEGIRGWGFVSVDHSGNMNIKNGTILLGENVLGILAMYDVNLDTINIESIEGTEAYGIGMRGHQDIHLTNSKIKTGGEGRSIVEDSATGDVILDEDSALDFSPGENSEITIKDTDGNVIQLTTNEKGDFVIPIEVTNILLNEKELSLCPGKTSTLTAVIDPENATDKTIEWESEDTNVATVDMNGNVKAVKEGKVSITATAGDFCATCIVTVEHIAGPETVDTEATCTVPGSKSRHCTRCDAKIDVTAIPATGHKFENGVCTVCGAEDPDYVAPVEPSAPVIIAGANGVWQIGSSEGLSFTSNAEYADFQKVQVDGSDLDPANYTVKEGSTIVTLKTSYLETLSVGKHTLAIVSDTGTATTEFTIKAAADSSAQTGDDFNIALYAGLAILAAAGATGATVYGRKKRMQ